MDCRAVQPFARVYPLRSVDPVATELPFPGFRSKMSCAVRIEAGVSVVNIKIGRRSQVADAKVRSKVNKSEPRILAKSQHVCRERLVGEQIDQHATVAA